MLAAGLAADAAAGSSLALAGAGGVITAGAEDDFISLQAGSLAVGHSQLSSWAVGHGQVVAVGLQPSSQRCVCVRACVCVCVVAASARTWQLQ